MSHVSFRKGRLHRTTADTFSAPDWPPRWVVKEGDECSWGRVQACRRARSFAVLESFRVTGRSRTRTTGGGEHGLAFFFEDLLTREVYAYQLSMRPLWPWEEG